MNVCMHGNVGGCVVNAWGLQALASVQLDLEGKREELHQEVISLRLHDTCWLIQVLAVPPLSSSPLPPCPSQGHLVLSYLPAWVCVCVCVCV